MQVTLRPPAQQTSTMPSDFELPPYSREPPVRSWGWFYSRNLSPVLANSRGELVIPGSYWNLREPEVRTGYGAIYVDAAEGVVPTSDNPLA
jgi:hypothetical protein